MQHEELKRQGLNVTAIAGVTSVAVRRSETPPRKQAQVDWGHLGTIEIDGVERKLWGFTLTLGPHPHDDGAGGAEIETRHGLGHSTDHPGHQHPAAVC